MLMLFIRREKKTLKSNFQTRKKEDPEWSRGFKKLHPQKTYASTFFRLEDFPELFHIFVWNTFLRFQETFPSYIWASTKAHFAALSKRCSLLVHVCLDDHFSDR